MIKSISFFSGIGGFDAGFERAGIETVGQCEIDSHCMPILNRHFPGAQKLTDIRKISFRNGKGWRRYEHFETNADVFTGGFPCQDLSIAGKRAGLAGGRSGLWYELHRLIAEYLPRWVVIENVPGLLSSNGGRDFAILIGGLTGIIPQVPETGWGNAGFARGPVYRVAYRVLDAQFFGVAQRRRRVFIVGSLGNGHAAQVLFEREGLSWDTPARGEAGARVAGTLDSRARKGLQGQDAYQNKLVAFAQNTRDEVRKIGGALSAQPGMKQQNYIAFESRFARNGRGAPSEIVPPLKAQSGKGDGAPLVAYNWQSGGDVRLNFGKPTLQATSQTVAVGVRRLTPTECERLQGFPDGWTDGQSDSQRYKQLGNAVCVPVAEWIARRIVEAHKPSHDTPLLKVTPRGLAYE